MADKTIQYTEEMVGENHPTKPDTLNRLSVVAHTPDGAQMMPVGANIASAATIAFLDGSNYVKITGTTTITAITSRQKGFIGILHFAGILTLTHHATNLILPGGASITTKAGDVITLVEYDTGKWRLLNLQSKPIINGGEIQKALDSAYLDYNSDNTIDIVFPYVFSDGSTWTTISGFSTATSGLTDTDIYWCGIYYDGSKSYDNGIAPVSGDISFDWSTSDTTSPTRPANGVKIGTNIRGVGDAGGDADIYPFIQFGKDCFYTNALIFSINVTQTITNFSISNEVSPTAKKVHGYTHLGKASGFISVLSTFYSSGSNIIMQESVGAVSTSTDLAKRNSLTLPLHVTQQIRNKGEASPAANLDLNRFNIVGFSE